MFTRAASSLIAIVALVSTSAAARALPCERFSLVTDACCRTDDGERSDQAELTRACCCDLTPVSGDPVAPDSSAVVQAATDVPQAYATTPLPIGSAVVSATQAPPAHARGPPGSSADLLTQRTSLLL